MLTSSPSLFIISLTMFRPKRRSPLGKEGKERNGSSRHFFALTSSSMEQGKNGHSSMSTKPATSHRVRRRRLLAKQRARLLKHLKIVVIASITFFGCVWLVLSLVDVPGVPSSSFPIRPSRTTLTRTAEPSPFARFSLSAPVCEPLQQQDVKYTLVTQFSYDRLWMMEHHCERWGPHNPISMAVYTNETVEQIERELSDMGCPLKQITVQTFPALNVEDYPINRMRNKALSAVHTTHVVYVDVDFWESTDLYDNLMSPTISQHLAKSAKNTLILPAFQLRRQCQEWRECPEQNIPVMPKLKAEAVPLLWNHNVSAFDPTNFGGHGSTRYAEWLEQDADTLLPIECVRSNRYEPYLVFRYCRDLPPFQEAFTGYGKNKMTWFLHLRRTGYQFWQMGQSFLIHYPHLDSKARLAWNGGSDGARIRKPRGKHVNWLQYKRGQNDQTFVDFRKWLAENVPDESRVGLCDNAADDDAKLWVDRDLLRGNRHKKRKRGAEHGGEPAVAPKGPGLS